MFLIPSFSQYSTTSNSSEAVLVKTTNFRIATGSEMFSSWYFLTLQPVRGTIYQPFPLESLLLASVTHVLQVSLPPLPLSSWTTCSLSGNAYSPVLNIAYILLTSEIISPVLTSLSSTIILIYVYFTSTLCTSNAASPT